MTLEPILYENSEFFSALPIGVKNMIRSYTKDNDPCRIINGPLSVFGEELEHPIRQRYEEFIEDCNKMITDCRFTIIRTYANESAEKFEYFIIFGLNDIPYGRLVYDLHISDHSIHKLGFPESVQSEVLEYLKIDRILDGDATKAGIDFAVKNVMVRSVREDTWCEAFCRVSGLLMRMKTRIQKRINVFICPIKAVTHELDDPDVDYILCTSDDRLEIGRRENVLLLRFMDITDGAQWGAFQKEQAEEVRRFLKRDEGASDLFICCDSGESRSAAIAAAVLLSQDQSDLPIWGSTEYHPNHYVFKLQCAALGIDLSDDEVMMRKKLNDDAFHSAIQSSYTDNN